MLDFLVTKAADGAEASAPTVPGSMDDALRGHVEAALRASGGNIRRTAAALGISRNTLRARMDKYGLRHSVGGAERAVADRTIACTIARRGCPHRVGTSPSRLPPCPAPPVVDGRRQQRPGGDRREGPQLWRADRRFGPDRSHRGLWTRPGRQRSQPRRPGGPRDPQRGGARPRDIERKRRRRDQHPLRPPRRETPGLHGQHRGGWQGRDVAHPRGARGGRPAWGDRRHGGGRPLCDARFRAGTSARPRAHSVGGAAPGDGPHQRDALRRPGVRARDTPRGQRASGAGPRAGRQHRRGGGGREIAAAARSRPAAPGLARPVLRRRALRHERALLPARGGAQELLPRPGHRHRSRGAGAGRAVIAARSRRS